MLLKFYRLINPLLEYCFYVETSSSLSPKELKVLEWLLAETFEPKKIGNESFLSGRVVEIGPRLSFETAYSTNAVAICHACGLSQVTRLERSRRYLLPSGANQVEFIAVHCDRMTECVYPEPMQTFALDVVPEKVRIIPLLKKGMGALEAINREMGLGMDTWDIEFYCNLFVQILGRDSTDVELFQLGQMNSDHAQHWLFKGIIIIDGEVMPKSLLDLIRAPWLLSPGNTLTGFEDNASVIAGYSISAFVPRTPGLPSPFCLRNRIYHPTANAETHNFPTGVEPYEGAGTGAGGWIRDSQAVGCGGLPTSITAGYGVGNLKLPGYPIPGENPSWAYPPNLASPLKILIEASNGASNYGNEFGIPLTAGFVRTGGVALPGGERRELVKPIMFITGTGLMDNAHLQKAELEPGRLIVRFGGPGYRIGLGGSSASSMMQGENTEDLDRSAVQRGNAEMGQKLDRVVRTCVEMGSRNPILSIHDQGAGGPCNVITELVDPAGGRVEIRKIKLGDQTMSVLEIWVAEYQESNALVIAPNRIAEFQAICERENVNCEILGEITGDGRIVVHDRNDDSTPVDLPLDKVLTSIPRKTFEFERIPRSLKPLELPPDLSIKEALKRIFALPSVGSKGYLIHKADRSVKGKTAQQQCCGPLQLPVSDFAIDAHAYFGLTGTAKALGEQPWKVLVDPKAGARMALAEALTNIVWAKLSDLRHIKLLINWMCAPRLPGEGAALWDAVEALSDLMIKIGIGGIGGKDSTSMAAKVVDEIVKGPLQVVISAFAPMPDIRKKATPDIKRPGESLLLFIDLAEGKTRMGGSALAQTCSQVGDEVPDVENPDLLMRGLRAVQEMIDQGLILAGHDRSDGGLITTFGEMAMAGNCGIDLALPRQEDAISFLSTLFSEELGLAIEYLPANWGEISAILKDHNVPSMKIGQTKKEPRVVTQNGKKTVLDIETKVLLDWWEATSDKLEESQMNLELARHQAETHGRPIPPYVLKFKPRETPPRILRAKQKPMVAILREEGCNGDREMAAAFFAAGLDPCDVAMTDLLSGKANLERFRGIAFPGGFSYADVLDAGKGWAGTILFNPKLRKMFDRFYRREDTFSLGVCNGCQLMALLGWVPWPGIPETEQPRFIRNSSGRNSSGKFESRWVTVEIQKSPAIMFEGMAGSRLGIWVAHGEGKLFCPNPEILVQIRKQRLAPLVFVDDQGKPTEEYPFNPNGSPYGTTALCSPDGRHLATMAHHERLFKLWQWSYRPEGWEPEASPWLQMFQNAREWCEA